MAKAPLLIISGLTASGKTSLSLQLARKIDCEIISADSMQVYQDMDIGTDKVSPEIRERITHHLIDIVSPEEEFSVAEYQKLAQNKINEITSKGKLPILVGGTGLYIKAVVEGFMLPSLPESDIRTRLKDWVATKDNRALHKYLASIDPEYARKIHPNDIRRVTRALEIYFLTDKTRSYYKFRQERQPAKYNHLKIALGQPRKDIYQKINSRVDFMLEKGLIEEVKELQTNYSLSKTASQAVGYKEIIDYLAGQISLSEAVRLIKRNTRRLAKKQRNFLKRDKEYIWIDKTNWPGKELEIYLLDLIKKKFFADNFTLLKEYF